MTERSCQVFQTASGTRLVQIPVDAFPGFLVYVYLIERGDHLILVDSGSGFGRANDDLLAGFEQASQLLGRQTRFADVSHIFLTHAHIDHFGGLNYIRQHTQAPIYVHDLDRQVITGYEIRLAVTSQRLQSYFLRAGVSTEGVAQLLELYRFNKALFHSVDGPVFGYDQLDAAELGVQFLHTPGHSPGHVVTRLDDVLLLGDQVLTGISPHQSPEEITLHNGLGHYLASLAELFFWQDGTSLSLAGHRKPITDLRGRILEILQEHQQRLRVILDLCKSGAESIKDISRALFPSASGYNILLALEETGAHVEYLFERGWLDLANPGEALDEHNPHPWRYRSTHPDQIFGLDVLAKLNAVPGAVNT